ncbi:hypothetical protein KR018_003765 [Drosophila ironensis]|nr:hypothetical protein KR018_003765 [Drosophila ironensis]
MCRLFLIVILSILLLGHITCQSLMDQLFPGFGGYNYPTPNGYPAYQDRRNAPRGRERDRYKDICRVVNANGFTNPAGVPKCPF